MQNIIITFNNIISAIGGFFSGIHHWFENTSLEVSYFKYIWSLRIKNFLLIFIVVVVFIAIVLFLKKVADGLVDEHYGLEKEKKESKLKLKLKQKIDEYKENRELDTDDDDEDDDLWYIKDKYRK